MPEQPILTVIIPCHGREMQVARAVQSVLAGPSGIDILIIDDATPGGLSLPEKLAGHPAVTLIRRDTNGGAGAARNTGLHAARTPLVAFLDSDDWLLPGMLSARITFAQGAWGGKTPDEPAAIACGWVEVNEAGRACRTRIPAAPASRDDFHQGCWFSPGSTLVAGRSGLIALGGFDERFRRLEDVDFFIRFAKAGGQFNIHPVPGAAISLGSAKSSHEISQASKWLAAAYCDPRSPDFSGGAAARDLKAYLDLEAARLAFSEGFLLTGALRMARSLLLHPRLTATLSPGWVSPQPSANSISEAAI